MATLRNRLAPAWRHARTLAVSTYRDAKEDRAPGLAAEMAFYAILALPPLLLAVFGLAGFVSDLIGPVSTEKLRDAVLDVAGDFLSGDTMRDTVEPTVDAVLERGRADVALLGLLLSFWSGSRALNATLRSITLAYDLEPRPAWQRRAFALGLTVGGALAGLALIPLLALGPNLGESLGLGSTGATVWRVLYWPVAAASAAALLATLYHFAVPWTTPWRRDLPGAALAVTLWLGSAAALRVYTGWAVGSSSTYGPLATPIVALLWLYVTAFAVVMGAELNAEVEKLWPRDDAKASD